MAIPFTSRLKHAWNAFMNKDPTYNNSSALGIALAINQLKG